MPERSFSWQDHMQVTFTTLLFISQIIVGVYLVSEVSQIEVLAYVGVGLYVFSGIIFGMLPVLEFRKKGGVRKGQSYIHTTKLVDFNKHVGRKVEVYYITFKINPKLNRHVQVISHLHCPKWDFV